MHSLNAHKFTHSHACRTLWEPFTRTQRVVSNWIHVHLRQLAYLKIPFIRTNKWPEETHFTKMVCNAPAARFCSSSLIWRLLFQHRLTHIIIQISTEFLFIANNYNPINVLGFWLFVLPLEYPIMYEEIWVLCGTNPPYVGKNCWFNLLTIN